MCLLSQKHTHLLCAESWRCTISATCTPPLQRWSSPPLLQENKRHLETLYNTERRLVFESCENIFLHGVFKYGRYESAEKTGDADTHKHAHCSREPILEWSAPRYTEPGPATKTQLFYLWSTFLACADGICVHFPFSFCVILF